MSTDLSRLLLGTPDGAPELLDGAYLTAWDAGTYANTVLLGAVTYQNLPVVNPSALAIGRVLLINTPGGPIVLGRLFRNGVT